jgi:hypothetical protein
MQYVRKALALPFYILMILFLFTGGIFVGSGGWLVNYPKDTQWMLKCIRSIFGWPLAGVGYLCQCLIMWMSVIAEKIEGR